jgi:hypothetical protein
VDSVSRASMGFFLLGSQGSLVGERGSFLGFRRGPCPRLRHRLSYPTPCAGEPRHATKSAKRRVRDLADEKLAKDRKPVSDAKGVDLWVVPGG